MSKIYYYFIYLILFLFLGLTKAWSFNITANNSVNIEVDASNSFSPKTQKNKYFFEGFLGYSYNFNYSQSFTTNVSYLLDDSINDYDYSHIELAYAGFEDLRGQYLYIGNTPTVLYQGFVGGWLDYGISSKNEALNSNLYGDFLGTKVSTNSLYYLFRKRNFKIALQVAGADNNKYLNSSLGGDRNFLYGLGLAYSIGPITFGSSFVEGNYDRECLKQINITNITDDSLEKTYIVNAGFQADLGYLYLAFGTFYDKNRWDLGNESLGSSFVMNYDNTSKKRKIVPQVMYGYKKYLKAGGFSLSKDSYISDNYLYLTLMGYITNNVYVYYENKIDFIANNHKGSKYNHFIGFKYNLIS